MSKYEVAQRIANIKSSADRLQMIFGGGANIECDIQYPFEWSGSIEISGAKLIISNKYDIDAFVY